VTFTRGGAFVINVAAVIYLLFAKRLFGLRGGRRAYDAERRGEQLLEAERGALTSRGGQAHDARTAPATGKVSP